MVDPPPLPFPSPIPLYAHREQASKQYYRRIENIYMYVFILQTLEIDIVRAR